MPEGTATSSTQQLRHVARGGTLNLAGAAVSAVAQLGLVVLLARIVEKNVAGQYFALTSAFLIVLAVATLGTESGLARFVLRFHEHRRSDEIVTCVRVARRPVLATALLLTALVFLAADPLADLLGLTSPSGPTAVRAMALLLPAAALNDVSLAGTRAFGRMRSTVVVDKVLRPVAQPLGAALVVGLGGGLTALVLSWAVPYAVAAGFSVFLLHRLLTRRGLTRAGVPRSTVRAVAREFWSFTWPRSVARICQIVLQRADIVIVAALLSPGHAAVYTAATRFVVLGQFAANAIGQVLQPRLSQILAHDRVDVAQDVVRTATAWNMAVSWPVYGVVGSAATVYLGFFGPEYGGGEAHVVVVVMAVAMLMAVAAGPVDTLLLMAGRSTTSLANTLVALVTNIALCLVLIPRWGIVGAAAAWGAAVAIRNGLAVWQVRRGLDVSAWSRAATLVALANVVCLVVPVASTASLGPLVVAGVALLGLVLYAFVLWRARRTVRVDLLLDALRRRRAPAARPRPLVGAAD